MSNLIELLFEGVAKNKVDSFVVRMSDEATLKSVAVSESSDLDLRSWQGRVLEILESAAPKPSCVSLNLNRVELGEVTLTNPLIQVLMHDGNVDVSLSFLDSEISCDTADCVNALHHACLDISRVVDARAIICGYEPVSDQKTRFFTGATQGPLRRFWE